MTSAFDMSALPELLAQYHDYFLVEHSIPVSIKPWPEQQIPNPELFEAMIPEPFRMASEFNTLEQSMLKPLAKLGDVAHDLSLYLKAQARKIDTLMRYVLLQQDDPAYRHYTQSYGGGGLCVLAKSALELGQLLEVKLFLAGSDGAVYAIAQVIEQQHISSDSDRPWRLKLVFRQIREMDRDTMVRASLHEQARQLKLRAEQRQQQGIK